MNKIDISTAYGISEILATPYAHGAYILWCVDLGTTIIFHICLLDEGDFYCCAALAFNSTSSNFTIALSGMYITYRKQTARYITAKDYGSPLFELGDIYVATVFLVETIGTYTIPFGSYTYTTNKGIKRYFDEVFAYRTGLPDNI